MSVKLILVAVTTILSLVLGSIGISAVLPDEPAVAAMDASQEAADDGDIPARFRARAYGVIAAIEGGTLTVATPAGSVDFVTDVNTLFFADGEQVTLEAFAVGDAAGAVGWWEEGGGVFHAFAVSKLADDRLLPIAGTLIEIDGDMLTIETAGGLLVTAYVDEGTKYYIRGVEDPGLDDLELGMKIAGRGMLNPDGTLQAHVIGAAEVGPREGRLRGEVVAVEGDTFTVRTERAEIVVQTDEETEFHVPGVENPSIADLEVGDRVAGTGVLREDGTAYAALVVVLPDDAARLNGRVTAVGGTTIVLETVRGLVDVLTDEDTVFHVPSVEEPGLDDIKVGDRVVVGGSWESESTFHAIAVGVVGGRSAGARGFVRGHVTSIGEGSFVVGTARGPVTVMVDEGTGFHVPGVDDAGFGDLEEGVVVNVRGTWNDDGTLQALFVRVGEGR
ncbi:MAG: DUF5666 domain-containing protein [Anaerolineae bacterium]|jgi:hypothetical protein